MNRMNVLPCEWNGVCNVPPFMLHHQGKQTSAAVGASSLSTVGFEYCFIRRAFRGLEPGRLAIWINTLASGVPPANPIH
jgi:hypothetical protein